MEAEQDEQDELVVLHTMDSGDEHEMDEIESHLPYHERVFTMVEVEEDECIMETIQQKDEMDEDDYEAPLHFLQSLEQMELTD